MKPEWREIEGHLVGMIRAPASKFTKFRMKNQALLHVKVSYF